MVFDNINRVPIYEKAYASQFFVLWLNHRGCLKSLFDKQQKEFHRHDFVVMPPGHVMEIQESSDDYLVSLLVISPSFLQNLKHIYPFYFEHVEYRYNSVFHLSLTALELTPAQQLVNRFKDALVSHFQESREVQYYGNLLCLSPKYFGSIIKKETGISANEWISGYVIVQAKSLLRHSQNLNIQQISQQLGFSDPAAFTRFFKTNAGVSPKEYRGRNNKGEIIIPPQY